MYVSLGLCACVCACVCACLPARACVCADQSAQGEEVVLPPFLQRMDVPAPSLRELATIVPNEALAV